MFRKFLKTPLLLYILYHPNLVKVVSINNVLYKILIALGKVVF